MFKYISIWLFACIQQKLMLLNIRKTYWKDIKDAWNDGSRSLEQEQGSRKNRGNPNSHVLSEESRLDTAVTNGGKSHHCKHLKSHIIVLASPHYCSWFEPSTLYSI